MRFQKDGTLQAQAIPPQIVKFMSRQSVSKELPIFSGNPIEWPNFAAQFHNSTKICGFTDAENQIRH